MKKLKKFAVILIFSLLFVFYAAACNSDQLVENYKITPSPNILTVGFGTGLPYYYLVDKNTGVVYLARSYRGNYGITVMLNRDGTPVVAEQVGIEY